MSSSFLTASFYFLLLFLCFSQPSRADPRTTEAAIVCGNRTATVAQRQSFVSNFLASLDAVTPPVSSVGYGTAVNGTGSTSVYTFGECMKDLSSSDCNLCFSQIKTQILRCYPFQSGTRSGRLVYDGCYLRFDEYNFFDESLGPGDRVVCRNSTFKGNLDVFSSNVIRLVRNLSAVANRNDGYAVGTLNRGNVSVYGLAQCWEYVNGTNCSRCLSNATSKISSCTPMEEGRVVNTGCYMRYSTQKFYDNSSSSDTGGGGGGRALAIVLSVVSSVLALLLVIGAILFYMNKKYWKRRKEKKQLGAMLATINKSKLNFSYETLEKATNYFHVSNKLGQGGSGSVYKGSLPDGKIVAIKRLFFNTRQWADHFFNEVNLISGIQHKNLVKLLGCSITGPESLLVYEYVPNQSLHDHLLVRRNLPPLSWEVRYNIILGTAEGLAHLHEELRIIHRDIKLSNILLEHDFTAKIADFGLARLFPEDRTHISTAVAGTLGYMAPEYVVCGQLTEKADVYSFGVLMIEVVCGRRNNSFSQDSLSILQVLWNLYGMGRVAEAVDHLLHGNFDHHQAERLLQVGLVCAQATADLRPSMSVVVKMITNHHEIGEPTQPAFLIHPNNADFPPFMQPETDDSRPNSHSQSSNNSITQSLIEAR